MSFDSKSQLARLLATENILVEHRRCQTATFDNVNRVLVIPILKDGLTNEIYDLFIGHEVGHALFTPADGWRDAQTNHKLSYGILNIVEDARIEKLIKRRYPGLKNSFFTAYNELANERDFFHIVGKNINEFNFIDRINLHFKIGFRAGVVFSKDEQILVDEVSNLETFDDVIRVATLIIKFMKRKIKKNHGIKISLGDVSDKIVILSDDEITESMFDPEDSEESDEEIEKGSDLDQNPTIIFSNKEEKKSEIENESDEEGDLRAGNISETEENSEIEEDDEESNEEDESEDDDIEIESETDVASNLNQKDLIDMDMEYVYANIPEKINLDNIVVPYKEIIEKLKGPRQYYDGIPLVGEEAILNFISFKNHSSKIVSYMVKEFEMRKNAYQLKKAIVSKTGDLNMNKIYSYKFNDEIFKSITIMPGGKSHGLIMIVDWSGSMGDYLRKTVKQLLNLVMFCRTVNIPFEVYAFTSTYKEDMNEDPIIQYEYKVWDLHMHKMHLMQLFSNKMNASEFSYMAAALLLNQSAWPAWFQLGSTPLNEAIICAMKIVPLFREKYKLQFVNTVFLTDGEGHNLEYRQHRDSSVAERVFSSNKCKAIIKHNKSGHSELIPHRSSNGYTVNNTTPALLNLFKKVTGSHVVGFFLVDAKYFAKNVPYYFKGQNWLKVNDEFRKNKFVVAVQGGYDEYYIMNANVDVDENADLGKSIQKSGNVKGITSKFIEFGKSKVQSRIILQRFIKMIS